MEHQGGANLTIGERIKQARKLKGLTQKQLGELSETSEITVRQYELGKRQPRLEQLRRIASALDVEWTDLVPEQDQGSTVIDQFKEKLNGEKSFKKISTEEAYRLGVLNLSFKSDEDRIAYFYSLLNTDGKLVASKHFYKHLDKNQIGDVADYIEKLLEIPQYQRQPPQEAPGTPSGGTDTTSPKSPSEGTGEGTENK